jgi:hypothetical protein
VTADYHSFWTRGKDSIFLSYRPMFHLARHCRQIILAVEVDTAGAAAYRQLKDNTEDDLMLQTSDKIDLAALLAGPVQAILPRQPHHQVKVGTLLFHPPPPRPTTQPLIKY